MADEDFPVVVKAFVGHATEDTDLDGVRRLEIHKDYRHLKLQGVTFGDDVSTSFMEDPDHPGFAKLV